MKKTFLLITLFLSANLFPLERLPRSYIVSYGNPNADIRIIEYFSFLCPHCVALFQRDFEKIKESYLETNRVYWEFHPVPLDLITVQAMACLHELTPAEKQLFLEVILQETDIEHPDITTQLMIKAMELLQKPLPDLEKQEYLSETEAYIAAFYFIKQEDCIEAIPTVEINGVLYPDDVPEFSFIQSKIGGSK